MWLATSLQIIFLPAYKHIVSYIDNVNRGECVIYLLC